MRAITAIVVLAGFLWGACAGGAEPADIDALIRDLRSTRSDVRARAAETLGNLGPQAAPAVRALAAALSDKSLPVQLESLIALSHIGPAARGAVPELAKILKGDESKLYRGAVDALGAIGPDAAEAAPLLIDLVQGDDAVVATGAGVALARILPPGSAEIAAGVPPLAALLKDARSHVRSMAVVALGSA